MNNILNIAVIGCAWMGNAHMGSIDAHPNARVYAVCDPAVESLEERKKLWNPERAVTDYRELVNDPAIDAVVIACPDQFHLEMTEAFLRAGKHVLCEKPMALTPAECLKMMQAEKESGKLLMVGQICRCAPAFMQAKKIVEDGRLGELFLVESEYAHCYEKARGVGDWRVTPERDGFIGGGCHAVDLLRWIAGNPIEVTAYANHKCLTDWPTNDCTMAIFKFPNNVIGKVMSSIGCRRDYTMRTVLYGTKGTLICDNTHPTISLFTTDEPLADGKCSFTEPQIIPVDVHDHNTYGEIADFVRAILDNVPLRVPSTEGADTIAVCYAAVQSAREGRPITIEYPRA